MLIFWDAGLVLMATPKTGTHALELALAEHTDVMFRHPPKIKHMTYSWAQTALPRLLTHDEFSRFRFVAMMRDPIDWLGSWYRYRRRDDLNGKLNSTREMDFSSFLSGYLTDPQPPYSRLGRQWRFLRTENDKVGVDYLFPYERMEDLVAFLEERLDCKLDLPRANVSPPGDLKIAEDLHAPLEENLKKDLLLYRTLVSGGDWKSV